ncbi:MAG: HYR domain-containing protein [Saprospiraceae bacterium]|nr:HYR domain-containing protein [Saprospiraceae bacterium]
MTNKSLLTYFIALFAMCSYFTMNAQCDPDLDPPSIVCPPDQTLAIGPGTCDTSLYWDVTATDLCSDTILGFNSSLVYANWSKLPSATGFTEFATDSVQIVGGGFPGGNRDLCYTFVCGGTFTFDWIARKTGILGFVGDHVFLGINGNFTQLTPNGPGVYATGTEEVTVEAGDVVCFRVASNGFAPPTTASIKNLFFTNLQLTQTVGPISASAVGINDGGFLSPGTHVVTYEAKDCDGNISTCSFNVVVEDALPVITCPANITIDLDTADCSRVFCYEVTATDNCIDMTVDLPGFQFIGIHNGNSYFISPPGLANHLHWLDANSMATALGGHLVTIEDADENTFLMNRIQFALGLGDNQYWIGLRYTPIISAFKWITGEPLTYANWGFGQPGIIDGTFVWFWDLIGGTWWDSPSLFNRRYIIEFEQGLKIRQIAGVPSGNPFPYGQTTNTFQVEDAFGQTATCSFTVDVVGSNSMACKNVNISLDAACQALITPRTVLTGFYNCYDLFEVTLSHYGHAVPNPVTKDYLGKTLEAKVTDITTGNSCWSYITIEDKLAPTIICEHDTMSCYRFENLVTPGTVEDCSIYSVRLLDELTEKLDCDEDYIKRIKRTWITEDLSNKLTDTCIQEILIERFNFDSLYFPPSDTTIYCQDLYKKDAVGHPHPYVTGVPTYGFWRDTIWPTTDFLCNVATDYVDTDLGEIRCVRKIMRNWRVREWWCNQEITRNWTQFIQIKDTVGPRIIHGVYDFHATTGHKSCHADVTLPAIEAVDDCHQLLSVDVVYPGGILKNQNGGRVLLPVGYDTIIYRLYDNCYNLSTDTLIVTVKDNTEPVAICDRRTVVSLNQNGTVWVPADVFDDGSFDECHLHHFEVRRMDDNSCGTTGPDDWGPEVGFCCEDVGTERMVAFKAIDFSGNESVCMVLVEVQDKDLPSIVCPPDITIDCRFPIDLNHLEVFGRVVTSQAARNPIIIDPTYYHVIDGHPQDGLALDNCNPNVTEEPDFSNMDQCGQGYILRWFYVTDRQGNRVRCHQTITIVNHNPFDETSIVWPLDLDTSGICDVNLLDPVLLSAPYNRPTYSDDVCSLVGVSYKDHPFTQTVPGDPCFKIFRVWKVIDWCHKDAYGDFMIFSDTQVIRVVNLIDPIITKTCRDTTICTYDVECRPIAVSLSIAATDDCTRTAELLFRYKVDLNSDGTIDIDKASIGDPVASGTWPLGRHTIKWEVEDRCGNTAKCQSQLNLINCKTPTAYCHRDISVGLVAMDLDGNGIPDTKMVQVWASDIDAGSSHSCGYPVTLSFSRDTADKSRTYTCDSLGLRNVELWVTDINGNTSVCKTRIIVWDNPMNAPACPNTLTTGIDGLITTETGSKVQSVEVAAESTTTQSTMTNFDGIYDFGAIASGADYMINPKRNDDWVNGVTTADIVKIQKHILGIEVFTSPYKMIAADVNNSKTITARDISEIRKMILGVTNSVPNNTSWKFVDQLYQFKNIDETLEENYPQNYQITNLNSKMNINFYGIKIGDVNESAKTRGVSSNGTTRSDKSLVLQADNVLMNKDEIHDVVIRSSNIQEFAGMQFTIQFNPELIEITEIKGNEFIGLRLENFNLHKLQNGLISLSWNGQVSNNDELFTLKVKANSSINLADGIFIGSSLTPALSVGVDDQEYPVNLNFIGASTKEFVLLQNEPNPWKSNTAIGMYLPHAGEVRMTIHDVHGKVLYMSEKEMTKGYQEWTIEKSILNTSGVYYYQVDFENHTQTKKMIVIE